MEQKLKIDVEVLKKSMLQHRPMKARFKMPMSEVDAYACLLAAMMAEVEYRHRIFCHHPISAFCYAVGVAMARVPCLKHSSSC